MEDQIIQANNLYKPAIDNIIKIEKHLSSRNIDNGLFFNNDHHMKIGKEIKSVQYPIPNIICKLGDIKTKIGMDIVTSKDYIGFVKFTINKEQFQKFDFNKLKPFKFNIYGAYFCKEIYNYEDLEKIGADIQNPRESDMFIKIMVTTVKEVETIIDKLTSKPPRDFVICCYTCNCGHMVSVNDTAGQCPICGEDSPGKRKYKQECPICNNATLIDQFGNGECEQCGWILSELDCQRQNDVIYPNLISLNKAKRLYTENKPLRPDLNDFLEGLYFYSEMEFGYKGLNCCLFLRNDPHKKIEFCWSPQNIYYFSDKEDFIKNAKIDGKYVRDIWNKVKNPKYI